MDNSALPMQIVKSNQDLLGHSSDEWKWNALIVVSLHDFKQVNAKNLEDHNEMLSVGA